MIARIFRRWITPSRAASTLGRLGIKAEVLQATFFAGVLVGMIAEGVIVGLMLAGVRL